MQYIKERIKVKTIASDTQYYMEGPYTYKQAKK